MNKKIREERGSIAVYVTIALLTFVIILSTIYMSVTSTRKSELGTILKIKESYEEDSEDIEEIYQNQLAKLTPAEPEQKEFTFAYTGSLQTFTAPADGVYQLQVWGAQGGGSAISGNSSSGSGAKGGYSVGEIQLSSQTTLYVYVGGYGSSSTSGMASGGFNGGGSRICF